jgi:hypothetical protein
MPADQIPQGVIRLVEEIQRYVNQVADALQRANQPHVDEHKVGADFATAAKTQT